MNDAIKILSENYVDRDCALTVTSGDATKAYLYDQKPATCLLSEGSDDTVTEVVDVTFKNWQGEAVDRTFDRIVLLNHNYKAITAEYYDGAAWNAIAEAALTLTAANTVIELAAPVTAPRMRVSCQTTRTANQEKYLGELKVCLSVVSLGLTLSDWQPAGEQKSGSSRLANGSLVQWTAWKKKAGTLSLENVPLATKILLVPLIQAGSFVTVVFCSDFDASEVYEMAIANADSVGLDRKAGLFIVPLELRER